MRHNDVYNGTWLHQAVSSVPPWVLGHELPTTSGRLGAAQRTNTSGWTLIEPLFKHICRRNGSAVNKRTLPFIVFYRRE